MKFFNKFDKVFLVNLKRRTDRLENFTNQVNNFDLGEFEVFPAYDGKELNMSEYNTFLSPGQLGLVLSNLDIINEAIKNNYEKIIIIEDDCVFENDIVNFEKYFEQLPKNWDMFYMGGNHNTHVGSKPPVMVSDNMLKLHNTYSTHFVAIRNTTFEHIKIILSKLNRPLDVSYVMLQKIFNVYCFHPILAKQLVDFSDIENEVTDYNWLIK